MSLVLLLVDGARADAFDAGIADGTLPSLARLARDGARHRITTCFPSVTGPAYVPILAGRFPGPAGLPGLRWYDRTRTRCTRPPYCRSYVGTEMRHMDRDLDPAVPTLFELAPSRLAVMTAIARGAPRRARVGRGLAFAARLARTHWRGDVRGWLEIDRTVAHIAGRRIAAERPAFAFVALLGVDKTSHAAGHASPAAAGALRIADSFVGELVDRLERDGRRAATRIWVVSDHGHSAVNAHDDLAGLIRAAGYRVAAHPWPFVPGADVAVMVSGNAMAHVYVELARRARPWWPALAPRWTALVDHLLDRPSIDLVMLPMDPDTCEVRARHRGTAIVMRRGACYAYRPLTGDPLALGALEGVDAHDAHACTLASPYPDAIVQIAHLAASARAGDIIVSAAPGWDLRARFEPIPHVSTHGALHRDHMLVPLLVDRPTARPPRRTADLMPSALQVLGVPAPGGLDGDAFA